MNLLNTIRDLLSPGHHAKRNQEAVERLEIATGKLEEAVDVFGALVEGLKEPQAAPRKKPTKKVKS